MASVLNSFSSQLNHNINQVHTDLQSSRFAPLKRRTSNSSIRSRTSKRSVSSVGNPYKSAPSDPQISGVSVNPISPATNLLASFNSVVPHITAPQVKLETMEQAPAPNAPRGAPALPALPLDIPIPHPKVLLDTEKTFKDRVKIIYGELKEMFGVIGYIYWLPFSWFLTFAHSSLKLTKVIMLLPLTIFINIYERRIRARFPRLPSIWLLMITFFPNGFTVPSFSNVQDLAQGLPAKVPMPMSQNNEVGLEDDMPTLEIDMGAIMQGNSDDISSSITNIQGSKNSKK